MDILSDSEQKEDPNQTNALKIQLFDSCTFLNAALKWLFYMFFFTNSVWDIPFKLQQFHAKTLIQV